MHIPDGFLDLKTVSFTNGFSLLTFLYSIRRILKKLDPEKIPLLGLSCAFAFLIESISFPVPGGTSVHLLGAFFLSIILGPFSAFFVISISLFFQALLLGHGGILTIGANALNIAFTGCVVGFYAYRFFEKILPKFKFFWIFLFSLLTLCMGSTLVTLELSISGRISFSKGIFPMLFAHTIAGIIEGIFTVSLILFLKKVKPRILEISRV